MSLLELIAEHETCTLLMLLRVEPVERRLALEPRLEDLVESVMHLRDLASASRSLGFGNHKKLLCFKDYHGISFKGRVTDFFFQCIFLCTNYRERTIKVSAEHIVFLLTIQQHKTVTVISNNPCTINGGFLFLVEKK